MSKSKKNTPNTAEEVKTEELDKQAEIAGGVVKTKDTDNKKDDKKKDDKKKDDKNKAKKDKKKKDPNKKGLVKKTKETMSELKKVTWSSFGDVVKKTGVVIAFVIIFGILIYGIDTLVGFLSSLLVG